MRDGGEIGPLVGLIVREGADVEEVRRGKANLEDVFLTLMEEQLARFQRSRLILS